MFATQRSSTTFGSSALEAENPQLKRMVCEPGAGECRCVNDVLNCGWPVASGVLPASFGGESGDAPGNAALIAAAARYPHWVSTD